MSGNVRESDNSMTQDTKKDDEGAAVTEAGRSNGRSEQL
jgi:hypothetical protein